MCENILFWIVQSSRLQKQNVSKTNYTPGDHLCSIPTSFDLFPWSFSDDRIKSVKKIVL